MSKIAEVHSVPHLDSWAGFAIKMTVKLESGATGWGAVPRGATPEKLKHLGIAMIEEWDDPQVVSAERHSANFQQDLAPKLIGQEATDQSKIDELLSDYSSRANWGRYGINSMLAASVAVARAAAREHRIELFEYLAQLYGHSPISSLPVALTTVFEGGMRIANDLHPQAIMIVPIGALSVDEGHRMADAVFFKLRDLMKAHDPPLNTSVGEQGGFVPKFSNSRNADGWRTTTLKALDLIQEAVEGAGFTSGEDFCLAIDFAMTSQSYDPDRSTYTFVKPSQREEAAPFASSGELASFYEEICRSHSVWWIEDGMHRDDIDGWRDLTARIGSRAQIVGDDLFHDFHGLLTPRNLIRMHADAKIANSVLVMPNRMGTLTSCIKLIQLVQSLGYTPSMSVRARETEDDSIADIAAACGVPQLKCGGLQCSERNSKYNRLKLIEELSGPMVRFGSDSFAGNRDSGKKEGTSTLQGTSKL